MLNSLSSVLVISLGRRGSILSRLAGVKMMVVKAHLASSSFNFWFLFFRTLAQVKRTKTDAWIICKVEASLKMSKSQLLSPVMAPLGILG